MNLEWKKARRAIWPKEMSLWAGDIVVAQLFKNIGPKGAKDTYRLAFLLPQIKVNDTLSSLSEELLDEAKAHAERVVKHWFSAATGDAT